jgi:hypothetical protein
MARPTSTKTQLSSYTAQYGTGYALVSGRVVSVGMWARNPLGGQSWHTSEGVCSDCILRPCDMNGVEVVS